MRNDQARLADILEEISLIEKYSVRGRDAFDHDELIQTWMVKHLENIAEACRTMSIQFRNAHLEIPWEQIIAQRTYLVHEYFGIDLEEVWTSVSRDVPILKKQIQRLIADATS